MADQRARVDVPNHWNTVLREIKLCALPRPPIGSPGRKFANDQRFNIGAGRFFVGKVGTDIPNVRIGQADDLAGITGIGKNFLIASERGIKNDFAAAARLSAGRTAFKYAPVLERQNGELLGQPILLGESYSFNRFMLHKTGYR